MEQNSNIEKLIVIGNGFDIKLGLESKFDDFIKKYFSVIDKFTKESLGKMKSLNTNVYTLSKILNDNYKIDDGNCTLDKELFNYFNNIKDYPQKEFNFWATYLLGIKSIPIATKNNWKDVEKNIHNFLIPDYPIHKINNASLVDTIIKIFDNGTHKLSENNNLVTKQNDVLINYFLVIAAYNCDENFKRIIEDCDIESKTIDGINSNNLKYDILNYLKNQLHEFERKFNDNMLYLMENNKAYHEDAKNLLKTISGNNEYALLNFNYTDPLGNGYESKNQLNIHGIILNSIAFDKGLNSLIIGTDSKSIKMSDPEYQFTKTFRIAKTNINRDKDILNNSIKEIIFFGHSLGVADYAYFRDIFNRFQIYNYKLKLTFLYSYREDNTNDNDLISRKLLSISALLGRYVEDCDHLNNDGDAFLHSLVMNNKLVFKKI